MKNILTVKQSKEVFIVQDISVHLISLLDFPQKLDIIKTELKVSFLLNYLNLLKNSNISYIEFYKTIKEMVYTIKLVKFDPCTYIFYFNSTGLENIKQFKYECEEVVSNFLNPQDDYDLEEILDLKNKDLKTYQLEIIYLLKNIKEELKELTVKNTEQDNLFLLKSSFTLGYFIEKLGLKNVIIILFAISIVESFIIEPLTQPLIIKIREAIPETLILE